jgi:hypothetical protein
MEKPRAHPHLPRSTVLLAASPIVLLSFVACRNSSNDLTTAYPAWDSRSDPAARPLAAGQPGAVDSRALADQACAAHLRQRGIPRADLSNAPWVSNAEADQWTRPPTIRCELCGTPIHDGTKVVGRIAIINTGDAPAHVYLVTASRGPFLLETVPPAPPPPSTGPLDPVPFPAPMRWTIPARSALDTGVDGDISADALRQGGAIRVRAQVSFWKPYGHFPCEETSVNL